MKKMFENVLARVRRQEEALQEGAFLAPILSGDRLAVRLAPAPGSRGPATGLVVRLAVEPASFSGWGLFRVLPGGRARLDSTPGLATVERYLKPLPRHRFLLVEEPDPARTWVGLPVAGDHRLDTDSLYPIGLVTGARIFDTCVARFDGARFWFEELDLRRDPALSEYLRESLAAGRPATELEKRGLGTEHRSGYRHALERQVLDQERGLERRLERALAHTGARLRDYRDEGAVVRVRYRANGRDREVMVRPADLTVVSAGICLSGRDTDFDLTSVTRVLEEADERWM